MMTMYRVRWALVGVGMALALGAAPAAPGDLIGLVTKTDSNPFFVKMREGAAAKAAELGVTFQAFAGKFDGDNDTQVAAIENLVSAGAKGILLTASDTKAIVPIVKKARDAGILVIALDTPLDPVDAADATFATDNFKAGELIGMWAAKTLGDKAKDAHIAFLDAIESQPSVDAARDQGFMKGFGIDIVDPSRYLDETDPRIVGHWWAPAPRTAAGPAWRTFSRRAGHQRRLHHQRADRGRRHGRSRPPANGQVLVTSVDGGCPGVRTSATASSARPRSSTRS